MACFKVALKRGLIALHRAVILVGMIRLWGLVLCVFRGCGQTVADVRNLFFDRRLDATQGFYWRCDMSALFYGLSKLYAHAIVYSNQGLMMHRMFARGM